MRLHGQLHGAGAVRHLIRVTLRLQHGVLVRVKAKVLGHAFSPDLVQLQAKILPALCPQRLLAGQHQASASGGHKSVQRLFDLVQSRRTAL